MQPPKDYEPPVEATHAVLRDGLRAALDRYPVLGLDEEELEALMTAAACFADTVEHRITARRRAQRKLQQTLEALKKEKG